MATKDANAFYAARGMARRSYTVSLDTYETIAGVAKEFPDLVQGDLVGIFAELLKTDESFASLVRAKAEAAQAAKPPKGKSSGRPRKVTQPTEE